MVKKSAVVAAVKRSLAKSIAPKGGKRYRRRRGRIIYRNPAPEMTHTMHKFSVHGGLSSTTGSISTVQLRANDMYDPIVAGGHQPMHFDVLSLIYNKFRVEKSFAKVRFLLNDDSVVYSAICGIYLEDDTTITPNTSIFGLMENSKYNNTKVISGNQGAPALCKIGWKAKRNTPNRDEDWSGTTASSPTAQTYFTLYLAALSSATLSVNYVMDIYYYATWYDRKRTALN